VVRIDVSELERRMQGLGDPIRESLNRGAGRSK